MKTEGDVQTLQRKKVYDGFQRILHGTLALSILLLLTTAFVGDFFEPGSERSVIWDLHIAFGIAFSVLLVFRFTWGWVGGPQARWRSYLPRFSELKIKTLLKLPERFGHAPGPALIYLVLYFIFFVLSVSGFALMGMIHGQGPLAEILFDEFRGRDLLLQVHGLLAWSTLTFIVVHIGAIYFHETRDGLPISQSMISGYQYRKMNSKDRRD